MPQENINISNGVKNNLEIKPEPAEITSGQDIKASNPPVGGLKIVINKKSLIAAGIIVVILFLGGLAYLYKGIFIAAMVNGSPIYRLTLISELEQASGRKTLESLITKKLINDEAKARGVIVAPADVAAELKIVEDQIIAQGGTLSEALAEQGVTLEFLKKQITVQKELEGLLAGETQVADEEIAKFITDNKVKVPKGQEAVFNEQIRNQLKQQKLSDAAGALLDSLKVKSKIDYFVKY